MYVGQRVKALVDVAEEVPGGKRILHARPGDFGLVLDLQPGCCPTVRWERSGMVCDVSEREVQLVFVACA